MHYQLSHSAFPISRKKNDVRYTQSLLRERTGTQNEIEATQAEIVSLQKLKSRRYKVWNSDKMCRVLGIPRDRAVCGALSRLDGCSSFWYSRVQFTFTPLQFLFLRDLECFCIIFLSLVSRVLSILFSFSCVYSAFYTIFVFWRLECFLYYFPSLASRVLSILFYFSGV